MISRFNKYALFIKLKLTIETFARATNIEASSPIIKINVRKNVATILLMLLMHVPLI